MLFQIIAMDLRIDSVYSLNFPKKTKPSDKSRKQLTCNIISDTQSVHSTLPTVKHCTVCLERIDIGKRKHISYRRWMKTHRLCDNNCFKRRGETVVINNSGDDNNDEATVHVVFEKPQTRNTRKRELKQDLNTSTTEHSPKQSKSDDTSTTEPSPKRRKRDVIDEHLQKQKRTNELNKILIEKHVQSIKQKIKQEPGSKLFMQGSSQKSHQVAEPVHKPIVNIKKEPASNNESFEEICQVLANAPKEQRESYLEKLKSIIHKDDTVHKDVHHTPQIAVNTGQHENPKAIRPSPETVTSTDSKTLATFQMVMIDGKPYILPSTSVDILKNGNTGLKKLTGNTQLKTGQPCGNLSNNKQTSNDALNGNPMLNSVKLPTRLPASFTSGSVNQSTIGSVFNPMLITDSAKPPTELPAIKPPTELPTIKPPTEMPTSMSSGSVNQSTIGSVLNPISSNLAPSGSLNLSLTALLNMTKNTNKTNILTGNVATNVNQKKEIHGHLVTHPDGKQYFVPLVGGQTFPSKPTLQLEPVNPGNNNPLGFKICKDTPHPNTSSSVPLPAVSSHSHTSNVFAQPVQGSAVKVQGTTVSTASLLPESVNRLNQQPTPTLLPQTIVFSKSSDSSLSNTNNMGATTLINSQSNPTQGNFVQFQSSPSTTISPMVAAPQMQQCTVNATSSTTNVPGQLVLPLLVNGTVQNIVLNASADGSFQLPEVNKPVTINSNKPVPSSQTAIPITSVNTGQILNNGVQSLPAQNINPLPNQVKPVQLGGLNNQILLTQYPQSQALNTGQVVNMNILPGQIQNNNAIAGQMFNQALQPGQVIAGNLPTILTPILQPGQLFPTPLQTVTIDAQGNQTRNVQPGQLKAEHIPAKTNQIGNFQSQQKTSSQIVASTITPERLQGVSNQTIKNNLPIQLNVSGQTNPVIHVPGNEMIVIQDGRIIKVQQANPVQVKSSASDTKQNVQSSVSQTKQNITQPIVSQPLFSIQQQFITQVAPSSLLQKQGLNFQSAQHNPVFQNQIPKPLIGNLFNGSTNQTSQGHFVSDNTGVKNVLPVPVLPVPSSQFTSFKNETLSITSQNSSIYDNVNKQVSNSQQSKANTSFQNGGRYFRLSVPPSNSTMPSTRKRAYSPTDLCKNITKSKDFKNQMEQNVTDDRLRKDGIQLDHPVPMLLKTSTGQVLPFSAVKPNYVQKQENVGNLVTSLLTTRCTDTLSPSVNISWNSANNQPLINVASGIIPDDVGLDSEPQDSHRSIDSNLVNSQCNRKTNVISKLIPAQGYSKTPPEQQLKQNIIDTHPLLQKSLQAICPNVPDGSEQTKRNKRKPQVVVRIDRDIIDVDDETSRSPDKDYSMFMVPIASTGSSSTSIVETGLRIPSAMLQELQTKKQISMEATVQKLKLNKLSTSTTLTLNKLSTPSTLTLNKLSTPSTLTLNKLSTPSTLT